MQTKLSVVLSLPQRTKKLILVTLDIVLIDMALWISLSLKSGVWARADEPLILKLVLLPLISVFAFIRLGLYRAVMRYIGQKALLQIVKGILISAGTLLFLGITTEGLRFPISTTVIYSLVAFTFVGGLRFIGRWLGGAITTKKEGVPVAVYGAGSAGRQLIGMLRVGHEYRPVAFLDDKTSLHGREIDGLEVFNPKNKILESQLQLMGVQEIFLAIPSIQRSVRKQILKRLEPLPFHVRSIPGVEDMISGARIDELQEVRIEDLLGRDPVPADKSLLGKCITGKVVMVTGAGGSIGSELCRQIVLQQPAELLLVEQSEYFLYKIEQELVRIISREQLNVNLVPILLDICNETEISYIFRAYEVNTIYHAAAYKHVPMVEHNIISGVQNNIFGTYILAQSAVNAEVETFVLISTDKAVRPTNVMGATKRFAELVLQGYSELQKRTLFCMVRFGNVLGSSGSVVPLFREQIQRGGPVTVTHPEITRYFMTIPEAALLVIQAGALGRGGDVFVLDMGEPVKIDDLAKSMIHLAGLEVITDDNRNGDIEIQYVGLRPGEKLYEELLIGKNVSGTQHPKIMRAEELSLPFEIMLKKLDAIRKSMHSHDYEQIGKILKDTVVGYNPNGGIVDHNYHKVQLKNKISSTDGMIH